MLEKENKVAGNMAIIVSYDSKIKAGVSSECSSLMMLIQMFIGLASV